MPPLPVEEKIHQAMSVRLVLFCLWMSASVVQAETIDGLKAKFPEGKYWNHAGSASNNPDGYTNTPMYASWKLF